MIEIDTPVHYTGTPEDTGTVTATRESRGLTGDGWTKMEPVTLYLVQWSDEATWHSAIELVAI